MNLILNCLPAQLSSGEILRDFLCSMPWSLKPYMLSLSLVFLFFLDSSLCCGFLISLFCHGALLIYHDALPLCPGGLLLCLVLRGGLLLRLLLTGGLLLCLLPRGGLLPHLFRRGGLLSCSGGLLLCRGVLYSTRSAGFIMVPYFTATVPRSYTFT